MNTSFLKLAEILAPSDWTSLKKFIGMSHREDADIMKLFDLYKDKRNHLQELIAKSENFEKDFSHLTKKGLLNLHSRLFIESENWLTFKTVMNDQEKKELILNKAYNDNGLYKLADQKAKKLSKFWNNRAVFSYDQERNKAQLLHQQYYSDNPIKYAKDSTLLGDLVNAQLTTTKLSALIYELELHNWGRLKQIDYSTLLESINATVEQLPNNDLSEVLKDLNKVVSNLDLEAFLKVKALLFDNTFEQPSELHTLTTLYLINAGIKLWQNGKFTNASESAELIEYGLSSGVLMKSGKIPRRRFFNLIATLGKLKSYAWTQEFIIRWHKNVETQNTVDTKSLAEALNAFAYQKYDLIIPLIRGIEFQDFIEKIRAQGLELIAIFIDRKDNYSFLRNYIANFKRTIKRNEGKLSNESIKAYTNFVKVVELLVQRDFRKLTIHLEKYNTLVYRDWLSTEINKG
ncbi:response regulator [Portibacter lacus]|uniref:Uncharacterized protein n=1 Tax=Portibacter lacus TaxID=1099794 RepID=A0AA37WD89_9BACT|nr:hypothetical protein [Portibacter lacus]GLR16588.1 hypothetical protein GCM10007940_12030 [Portibacter lacus]